MTYLAVTKMITIETKDVSGEITNGCITNMAWRIALGDTKILITIFFTAVKSERKQK